jgi:hypothetical protein
MVDPRWTMDQSSKRSRNGRPEDERKTRPISTNFAVKRYAETAVRRIYWAPFPNVWKWVLVA